MNVAEIKKFANEQLADGRNSDEHRRGIISMLEKILHATGNYEGFNYNYWNKTGFELWQKAGEPDFPEKNKFIGNESDRVYY